LLIAGLRDLLIGLRFIDFFLFFTGIRAPTTLLNIPKSKNQQFLSPFITKPPSMQPILYFC